MYVIRNFNGDYWNNDRAAWIFKTKDATHYTSIEEAQRDANELNGLVITIDPIDMAKEEAKRQRCKANRRARDEAMRSLGLKRVRGNLGGIYWE